MHNAASVAAISGIRRSQSMYRVINPVTAGVSVQASKATGATGPSVNSSPVQSAATMMQSNLPVGFLLSVSQPAANNARANTDYNDMENALRSGNLAAAQQAYLLLQSDLLFAQPATGTAASANSNTLNVTA